MYRESHRGISPTCHSYPLLTVEILQKKGCTATVVYYSANITTYQVNEFRGRVEGVAFPEQSIKLWNLGVLVLFF